MEWQPISTAPRNGTPVLLGNRTTVYIGNSREGKSEIIAGLGFPTGWDFPNGSNLPATHWQSLPTPPESLNENP